MRLKFLAALVAVTLLTGMGRTNVQPQSEFSAVIVDNDGTETILTSTIFSNTSGQKSTSLRCMRGKSSITIPFGDIKRIEVYPVPPKNNMVPATVQLNSGEELKVRISGSYWYGTTSFGSEFSINTAWITSLTFVPRPHPWCNTCRKQYHDPKWSFCPIDGTKLKVGKPTGPIPTSCSTRVVVLSDNWITSKQVLQGGVQITYTGPNGRKTTMAADGAALLRLAPGSYEFQAKIGTSIQTQHVQITGDTTVVFTLGR